MAANYVLKAEAGQINATPTLFREYASQYLQCDGSFMTSACFSYSPVPYFLACRAIELLPKAEHRESQSRKFVKDLYGHNLKKCYDDLAKSRRTLDSAQYLELGRAGAIYNRKGFEYVSIGDAATALTSFPDLDALRRVACRLMGN